MTTQRTGPETTPASVQATRCRDVPLPSAHGLAWDQAAGRACIACNRQLTTGAVYRGRVFGHQGSHNLDADVWCCPDPVT
ncbi:hypothetical protein [Streptomyces sp. NPDC002044]|uniref:hypothetical protein n=1 Tax=Streptomyces sp. NPDC002044 TaxID=3154662 RepID=UPI003331EE78